MARRAARRRRRRVEGRKEIEVGGSRSETESFGKRRIESNKMRKG